MVRGPRTTGILADGDALVCVRLVCRDDRKIWHPLLRHDLSCPCWLRRWSVEHSSRMDSSLPAALSSAIQCRVGRRGRRALLGAWYSFCY